MNNKNLLIGGVASVVVGLALYFRYQIALANKLCFGANKFKVLKLRATEVVVGMNFQIKNLDKLSVHVINANIDIYANNSFITKIKTDSEFDINPNAINNVPIQATINPKQLASSVGLILGESSLSNINITFKGKIKIKKFGIKFGIPFDYSMLVKEMQSSGESPC